MKTFVSWTERGRQTLPAFNLLTCVAIFLLGLTPAFGSPRPASVEQEPQLPAEALQRVESYFEAKRSARYMEQNCEPTTYPGWEELPLQKCTYSVKGNNDPERKTATVIMLNASPGQLARWVVNTCMVVTGGAAVKCTRNLSKHIVDQSGAQFPIAGIVFEDLLPTNGRMKIFGFRNGVTARISGLPHVGTNQPSPAQIESSLNGEVTKAYKFARVQSTTREDYRANGGTRNVDLLAWLDVTRDLYKAAWGNDRNELMIAWARANIGRLR